jgi:hypothetical protein
VGGAVTENPYDTMARRLYAAFEERDLQSLTKLIAEDAVWHIPGRNAIAGTHVGRDAVLAYYRKLAQMTRGTFHVQVSDVGVGQGHAYVALRTLAERDGRRYEMPSLLALRIEDGKIREARLFPEDAAAFDAFWA